MSEIFGAMGMRLDTPGTARTAARFLKALYDATEGYEGDEKLITAFPTECGGGPDCQSSQVIEGPIPFFSLCEHHALRVREHESTTRTTFWRGNYQDEPRLRTEFLSICRGRNWTM